MADNYLERRMEEYRAGKLASKPRASKAGVARKEGDVTLNFKGLVAVVLGGSVSLAEAVVKRFRAADCNVALCHDAVGACTKIAQSAGCRYYPFDPHDREQCASVVDDMVERRGGVDVIVDLRGVDDEFAEEAADDAAMLLLLHSHPRFGFIRSMEIEAIEE